MLRVGKVGYLNTLPLFYRLEGFEIVEGHPSELVKLLREGKIEAGIVSSVEYFFNPESYWVLPDISVSSKGSVCSVLLLSKKPLEVIKSVRITPNSMTSRYLLTFVLKEGYGILPEETPEEGDAFLVIGDEAIDSRNRFPYVYDLGEEWFKLTKLPFVFALFLVRKEASREAVSELLRGLKRSVRRFFEDLKLGKLKLEGDSDFMKRYFCECIDYSLGEEHMRSLNLFFSFMEKETGKPAPEAISLFRP